jgi:hypothetical protein
LTVDLKKLRIGDKVWIEATIHDIDREDEDVPFLLKIEDDTLWAEGDCIVALVSDKQPGEGK